MQAVAVILALAVLTGKRLSLQQLRSVSPHAPVSYPTFSPCASPFTGCNARSMPRQVEATQDLWEVTVDRFWQYISNLNEQADGVVQNIKASQLSRELE